MKTAAIIAVLLAAFAAVGGLDKDAEHIEQATYCDMVQAHQQTAGQFGWPDYRGNAAQVCQKGEQQ